MENEETKIEESAEGESGSNVAPEVETPESAPEESAPEVAPEAPAEESAPEVPAE